MDTISDFSKYIDHLNLYKRTVPYNLVIIHIRLILL